MIAIDDGDASFLAAKLVDPTLYAEALHVIFPQAVGDPGAPAVGDWHRGAANRLFCDGHVEVADRSRWMDGARRRGRATVECRPRRASRDVVDRRHPRGACSLGT